MIDDYGYFIDFEVDTDINIDNLSEDLYYYKKKLSDDNITVNYNNNNKHIHKNYNKTNIIIFSVLSILTYYLCYIIHHQNY